MELCDEEMMRYRKKSRTKPPRKATHKHLNEQCILEYPANWFMKEHEQGIKMTTSFSGYCPICGKVGEADIERWYVHRRGFGNAHSFVWNEPTAEAERELDPDTRTLPTFRVKDPFVKFVEVNNDE